MQPWLVRYVVPADIPLLGGQDLSIPTYLFLATVGYLFGVMAALREADRAGQDGRAVVDLSLVFLAGGILGGRLGYVLLEEPRAWLKSPLWILDLWQGGMDLYGGIAGAAVLGWVWARRRALAYLPLLELAAPALALGLVFGRLGCLAAGTAYGKPIDVPWGIEWPWGVVLFSPQVPELLRGVVLHPTQLYLALLDLGLFLLLRRVARRGAPPGTVLATGALVLGLGRLVIDPLRMDLTRWPVLGMAVSGDEALSVALAVVGAGALLRLRRGAAAGAR